MFNRAPWIKIGWVSLVLGALVLLILSAVPPSVWDAMSPASCLPDGCFCEAVSVSQPIRQPANTTSSLGFAAVGLWILIEAWRGSRRSAFSPNHQIMLGVSAIVIGVGSAFYHASMTFVGQFFDIFGMYLLTSLMWVYALQRLTGWRMWTAAAVYFGLNAALTALQIGLPETRRYAFAVVLLLALLTEAVVWRKLRPAREYRWLWAGLLTFAAAYLIWSLDNSGAWCDPDSWLQGHAVWHVLGAVAVACLWRWYVSEP